MIGAKANMLQVDVDPAKLPGVLLVYSEPH